MSWQITPPALILLSTTVIVSFTTWLVWRRRETPGGHELFRLLGAILIWTLASAMETASSSLSSKILWSKIEYLGATNTAPFLLVFCMAFTHHGKWCSRRNLVMLWTIPVTIFLLAATNEWHHLIWTAFEPSPIPGNNLYIYQHGAAYWVYVSYTYLYAAAAAYLLIQEYRQSSHLYRRQSGTILFSMIFPWIGSSVYVFNINPMPGLDTTPISFAFTAIVIVWGIYSTQLLDLIPIAHNILLQSMQDGVIVTDPYNRVVETNPAMAHLLGQLDLPVGKDTSETFQVWPSLASVLMQRPELSVEITLPGRPFRYFDVRVTRIISSRGSTEGYLTVLREITGRKQAEVALEAKSREMEQQAITDELTNLYNRRYINRLLEHELNCSQRDAPPLSLALLDIDDFKQLNDSFGHHFGDDVLRFVANVLRTNLRANDVAARIGGDEFLVIMPQTDLNSIFRVIERVRIKINEQSFATIQTHISVSAGLTAWSHGESPKTLLKRADQLLYRAKNQGRNCIVKSDQAALRE